MVINKDEFQNRTIFVQESCKNLLVSWYVVDGCLFKWLGGRGTCLEDREGISLSLSMEKSVHFIFMIMGSLCSVLVWIVWGAYLNEGDPTSAYLVDLEGGGFSNWCFDGGRYIFMLIDDYCFTPYSGESRKTMIYLQYNLLDHSESNYKWMCWIHL